MKYLILTLLFLQIQVMAQNGIVLCRNFPCNIANNYYSFMWDGKVFSRYSKEVLLTYEGSFFLESEKERYIEKNTKTDTIIETDVCLLSKLVTKNQINKKIRLFLKSRNKNILSSTSVYFLNNNALVVEKFLDKVLDKYEHVFVDTLSSLTVKKKNGRLCSQIFREYVKIIFC